MKRAGLLTVSPGANSGDVVVVRISLSRTPWRGVPVDGGAPCVGDAHVVEREHASRPCRWPVVGQTAGTAYITVVCTASFVAPFDRSVDKKQ